MAACQEVAATECQPLAACLAVQAIRHRVGPAYLVVRVIQHQGDLRQYQVFHTQDQLAACLDQTLDQLVGDFPSRDQLVHQELEDESEARFPEEAGSEALLNREVLEAHAQVVHLQDVRSQGLPGVPDSGVPGPVGRVARAIHDQGVQDDQELQRLEAHCSKEYV